MSSPPYSASGLHREGNVERGTIDVSTGVATADPAGASGTDSLVLLEFRVRRAGVTEVKFSEPSELRNGVNETVPGLTVVPGYVLGRARN